MSHVVGRPMEILLIEDDILQARLALEAVKRGNFQHRVSIQRDGQDALDFLLRRGIYKLAPRPDLILLDLRLPGLDGLDLLAEVRHDPELKSIPVVIMTSSQDEQDRLACEEHSVQAFLTKPVDLEKFLAVVKQLRNHWREDVLLPAAVAHA